MKNITIFIIVLVASGLFTCTAYAVTIFVDEDASGGNSGESWTHAFTDLQAALSEADPGDEIWVAEGIYKPSVQFDTSDVRSAAFQMKNQVAIYGGFDPSNGDIAFEDRDWNNNATIASGDIGIEGDNSYHVFYHPDDTDTNLDSTAILDGFIITCGNADNYYYSHNSGGGMYNDSSSPTLTNCIFTANRTPEEYGNGGGVDNYESLPKLINCTFSGNSAFNGGGIYNHLSSPTLTDCFFTNNSASYGGGMRNSFSSPMLTNCIFTANWVFGENGSGGGGVFNYKSPSPMFTNCTFSENRVLGENGIGGGGAFSYESSSWFTNCIMWGDMPDEIYNHDTASTTTVTYSDIQGGHLGTGNIDEDPLFVDISGLDPANWDLHLQANSPCIDAGDNSAPDLPEFDFEGDDRRIDDPLTGDTGNGDSPIVDMGADEYTLPCEKDFEEDFDGDFDGDLDIDGSDLAILTSDLSQMDLADFALVYGNIGCTENE